MCTLVSHVSAYCPGIAYLLGGATQATGTPRKRGKGKGPAVSKEKTWFWGWRKTPQSIGARQAQSSTEGKASAEAGRTGSDSGGNSVFSSRSSSQTSGPGSALLGSPASTQYNTPQSTPTSKGSTPAIAEEDETADGVCGVLLSSRTPGCVTCLFLTRVCVKVRFPLFLCMCVCVMRVYLSWAPLVLLGRRYCTWSSVLYRCDFFFVRNFLAFSLQIYVCFSE